MPAEPGLHLLVYDSNHARLTLEGDRFEQHLAEQGLERVSALRKERGESAKPAREIYSRCAKALLQVGAGGGPGAGYDRALGLPLELSRRRPLRARRRRRAAAAAPLPGPAAGRRARRGAQPGRARRRSPARTDAAGRVALALPGPGFWLVKAVHMVEAPAGSDADWESFWASLTFAVPAAAATKTARRETRASTRHDGGLNPSPSRGREPAGPPRSG